MNKKKIITIAIGVCVVTMAVILATSLLGNDKSISLKETVSNEQITESVSSSENKNTSTSKNFDENITEKVKNTETTKEKTNIDECETTNKRVNSTKKDNTVKPSETNAQKPKPVESTKPTPANKPNTKPNQKPTKSEYYASLTSADMEELKRYTIAYIKQRGYHAEPALNWNTAGFSTVNGIDDDLTKYGNEFKKSSGVSPLESAKRQMKEAVDYHIYDYERANGPGSIIGMYPMVRRDGNSWQWALGYI